MSTSTGIICVPGQLEPANPIAISPRDYQVEKNELKANSSQSSPHARDIPFTKEHELEALQITAELTAGFTDQTEIRRVYAAVIDFLTSRNLLIALEEQDVEIALALLDGRK